MLNRVFEGLLFFLWRETFLNGHSAAALVWAHQLFPKTFSFIFAIFTKIPSTFNEGCICITKYYCPHNAFTIRGSAAEIFTYFSSFYVVETRREKQQMFGGSSTVIWPCAGSQVKRECFVCVVQLLK